MKNNKKYENILKTRKKPRKFVVFHFFYKNFIYK